MKVQLGRREEEEGMSNDGLGFMVPLSNITLGQELKFQDVETVKRCEDGERERAWPIESRVLPGLKVSLQSLLMRSPWEPINLCAAAISIRCGHTHSILSDIHNKAFIHSYKEVSALDASTHAHKHTLSQNILPNTTNTHSVRTSCLIFNIFIFNLILVIRNVLCMHICCIYTYIFYFIFYFVYFLYASISFIPVFFNI